MASKAVGKMAFTMVPHGTGGPVGQVEGWTYLIPDDSKNKQAAHLFIQWMMVKDQQLELYLHVGASLRPDVFATPEVQAISYLEAAMDTNAVARPKPTIAESPHITGILVRELSE